MKNDLFKNIDYIGNYRVFCFSDIYMLKHSEEVNPVYYKVGDFIPTAGYSYLYKRNLLIIDYMNRVIHVIKDSIYRETIKVIKNSINIKNDSFICKMLSEKTNLSVIDVYGDFLKIKDVEDILVSMNEYPVLETYFTRKNYDNFINDKEEDRQMVIDRIDFSKDRNRVSVSGFYKSKKISEYDISALIDKAVGSIYTQAIESFRNVWILDNDLFMLNEFLCNIRVLYFINKYKVGMPFRYYKANRKFYTHVDRVDKKIKGFILFNSEEVVNWAIETIFTNCEYEDEYEDFIISTVSTVMDKIKK